MRGHQSWLLLIQLNHSGIPRWQQLKTFSYLILSCQGRTAIKRLGTCIKRQIADMLQILNLTFNLTFQTCGLCGDGTSTSTIRGVIRNSKGEGVLSFDPKEWLASNFSSQCHPWITKEGQKKKGNDHQLKRVLIVKKFLLGIILENVLETVWRLSILMFGWKGLRKMIMRQFVVVLLVHKKRFWKQSNLQFNADLCWQQLDDCFGDFLIRWIMLKTSNSQIVLF